MNKYAYFLGCITPNRYPGIELATRSILKHFGIELVDMKGASCCPAPGVIGSFDLWTWLLISARNITIAEEMGTDIMATCNGCYATLQEANSLLKRDNELRRKTNQVLRTINKEYQGTVDVKHIIEILKEDITYEAIKERITRPLNGIKVAVHYGCHFLKPSDVRIHGSTERPTILDDLVKVLGAESVNYKDKMDCCGAGGGVRAGNLEVALDFTQGKIESMLEAGADCLVTLCAFCHFQFDKGQIELAEKQEKELKLPVVFVTQLLGLALDRSPEEVGLNKNLSQIESFTSKLPKHNG